MSGSVIQRALEAEKKPNANAAQAEIKTINRYKHLEGTQLPLDVKLIWADGELPVALNEISGSAPVLLIIQPGPSTSDQAKLLKQEKEMIEKEKSEKECWMTRPGLSGCGLELMAWSTIDREKPNLEFCRVGLSLKDSKTQQQVIKEKSLNFGLVSLTVEQAKKFGFTVNEINGVNYIERGTLLLSPNGRVYKSYDVSVTAPVENAEKIYETLLEDIRVLREKQATQSSTQQKAGSAPAKKM